MAKACVDIFFNGLSEHNNGYWLLDMASEQVSVCYSWLEPEVEQCSLEQWLLSLDSRCVIAFQQGLHMSLSKQEQFVSHYCHSDAQWLRLVGMPIAIQGQQYLLASVQPLHQPSIQQQCELHHPSSGLLSPALFRELLIQAIRLSQRNHEPFALLSIKCEQSDLACHATSQILRQQLRRSDSIAQFTDTELVVLLYGLKRPTASKVHHKLCAVLHQQLADLCPQQVEMAWAYYPEQGDNVDTLLAHRFDTVVSLI